MAFIRHRGKTYSVVYKILDENGEEHTTSETFATQKEADKRKKEIEYKQSIGKFEVQKCATLKELIESVDWSKFDLTNSQFSMLLDDGYFD
mgnify:CR=1 FL=1